MNKKAQGLSINIIIVAAIALIILVVIIAVFAGRMGFLQTELSKSSYCSEQQYNSLGADEKKASDYVKGGKIRSQMQGCQAGEEIIYGDYVDLNPGDICCRPIPQTT